MLNLIIHNQSEDQKKAVDVIASENIRILEEAKTGENCYADSQGWLDTEGVGRRREYKTSGRNCKKRFVKMQMHLF